MVQLIRDDGVIFDVLGAKPGPFRDAVWLKRANDTRPASGPWGFGREVLERDFTAYPPQERPAEQTDDPEPLTAYRKAFCPADDKELEAGHRVVEAYAGALVDALFCGTCNRHFAADTLVEIKLWKD